MGSATHPHLHANLLRKALACLGGVLLTGPWTLHAASYTWDGGGGSSNWSDAANWINDIAPVNDGSADIVLNTNDFYTSVIDGSWSINGLAVMPPTPSSGPLVSLGGGNLSIGAGGIFVGGSSLPRPFNFNLNVRLTANQQWNGIDFSTSLPSVTAGHTLDMNGYELTLSRTSIASEGKVVGNGTIFVDGSLPLLGDLSEFTGNVSMSSSFYYEDLQYGGTITGLNRIGIGANLTVDAQTSGTMQANLAGEFYSVRLIATGTLTLDKAQTYGAETTSFEGGGTLRIGHDEALGAGTSTFVLGNLSDDVDTLEAIGGDRTLNQDLSANFGSTFAIAGTNDLTFRAATLTAGSVDVQEAGTKLRFTSVVVGTSGTFAKQGAGDLEFSGTGNNTLGFDLHIQEGRLLLSKEAGDIAIDTGTVTVDQGASVELLGDEQIDTSVDLTLDGGTFALNGHDETLGALDLESTSFITFGNGDSALSFANSAAEDWTGSFLTIMGYTPGLDTLRFGIDGSGLTALQLSLLRFADYGNAAGQIDANGFVTPDAIPEPGTMALFVLALAVFGLRRFRPRSA